MPRDRLGDHPGGESDRHDDRRLICPVLFHADRILDGKNLPSAFFWPRTLSFVVYQ